MIKIKIIQTKVTEEELEKIKKTASMMGLSRSGFFKMCALEKCRKIEMEGNSQ